MKFYMGKKYPFFKQLDSKDCGPTCLRMISKYHGKHFSTKILRDLITVTKEGSSLLGISNAAEKIGLRTLGIRVEPEKLVNEVPLPCIAHWKRNHFLVIYDIKKSLFRPNELTIKVADPSRGIINFKLNEFVKHWATTEIESVRYGHCLLLEPKPEFYSLEEENQSKKSDWLFLLSYLKPHKAAVRHLLLSFIISSIIQLALPFLTQAVVDKGINYEDISFLTLILMAQLALTVGKTSVEFIRSWIMLHLSTKVNITMMSDFIAKLTRLPISYFDNKMIGDLMQRMNDNSRVQSFVTNTAVSMLFSLLTFLIFSVIIALYDFQVFSIFLIGSILHILWVNFFLRYRRDLDNRRFAQASTNQNSIIELISGMQDIKLNNNEIAKRWSWERIQAMLYRISVKSLVIGQYQQGGAFLINSIKNFTVTYFTAKAVIDGEMTLGMMLAIQYIIGELNVPIDQFISFATNFQDAQLSLERLSEIHSKENEKTDDGLMRNHMPPNHTIALNNVSFKYSENDLNYVLKDISIDIKEKEVTAIVGTSGSGKTTLVKLMLGFYQPSKGEIVIGGHALDSIKPKIWRENTGVVMQENYIFNDSISNNITISDENANVDRLYKSAEIANIDAFIRSLPHNYNTLIGSQGLSLSQGQKQRILIARAAYKNPAVMFFDEATNSLDANNETIIMENLNRLFEGKTVVVVAHRLSTVRNANKIVVLNNGMVAEQGTHDELLSNKSVYYELVKNQLKL